PIFVLLYCPRHSGCLHTFPTRRSSDLLDGEQRSRRSVTNIGMRPTFNATSLSVETHLLDAQLFSPPKRIEVRFWERLRDEKKFKDRKSTRLNSSHQIISYAVFCLKKKK